MEETRPVSSAPDLDSHAGALPRHVAIIMDGNNRWARQRDLPGVEGHRAGEATVREVIRRAARRGIEVVTLFAFSSENWRRPEDEVQHLLALFVHALGARVAELHENGIRLRFIGERSAFNDGLRRGMAEAEQLTANNDGMTLAIAVNYGGQWDLTQAARRVAQQVRDGELAVEQITDAELGRHVSLADLPPPDLLIRTGGEQRLSNFLLWQAAYSEFYFTPTLWPDFDGQALDRALADYASRQRRFGRSGEEVSRLDGDSSC
ncbi:polyprenyl diphosphate synthase [Alloalcanivorax xenomutans]|jgi:undecaprenyl diphosphate synthase|uniref:Ditrans,polycis-undecaprenyl-diphosphate synthase ((2E,6E)-farnesyl-diphosphate specific) n=1 Tax=Alloalcanivorax xenomutans TaxID=1094342 RepID=A0A9Q3ZGF7_9GAMM|nr:polyprenyl diphosphate synthase [Alloalcanivorax xenomutans]ERS14662.1 UDP pyrophosphate synthase [Alcanivorax sp. PN-3]KYZ88162.1 di-trans,poly-cis-decaprenylcistransferase [Alcanivorax sp. KX64203]PHS68707.1 MAG: di-trans,poly-cis-decaprenylcistransferase [Alcanivorax sp.]ARB45567.1 farnesyl-diphosphate synthase [Alloalcanivorax xenomutans]MCE7509369.1 polyprenyl diphosphate synthase [Alloalcanivorax xenomutans]